MPLELISLGILFSCAIIGGIIAARFKQPAVFGLLLVGAIIGPNLLNIVHDMNMIKMMAEIGAILLLFVIGLEFDLSKMMKLGARYILVGVLKFPIVVFFGYEITMLLGLSSKVALFIGVILAFSSTVVIVKVLEQKEMFHRKEVPLLVVALIIEDLLAVLTITFFSGIKSSNVGLVSIFEHLLFSVTILIAAYLVMLKVLKHGVNIILKNTKDDNIFTFLSLSIGALFSWFALFLGLAPSAGAFLAGSLIASLPNSKEYGRAIQPYAMIFTSVFFISMGTLVDFKAINSNLFLIEVLLAAVILSRLFVVGFLTYLFANFKNEQPLFSSIAMMSIGEFSLLVAKESEKFGLGIDLVTITAVIIFITAITMSIGINYSESLHSAFSNKAPIKLRLKLEKAAEYIRKFFDQLEIEHFITKKLRHDSKMASVFAAAALFSFFLLRRISFLILSEYPNKYLLYVFYAFSALALFYLLRLVYKRLRTVHNTLSIILTHVDSSRSIKKCTKVLNSFLLASLLFFLAMLFPFTIFALNFGAWVNIIPFVLLVPAFHYIRKTMGLIADEGRYEGFNLNYAKAAASKA